MSLGIWMLGLKKANESLLTFPCKVRKCETKTIRLNGFMLWHWMKNHIRHRFETFDPGMNLVSYMVYRYTSRINHLLLACSQLTYHLYKKKRMPSFVHYHRISLIMLSVHLSITSLCITFPFKPTDWFSIYAEFPFQCTKFIVHDSKLYTL